MTKRTTARCRLGTDIQRRSKSRVRRRGDDDTRPYTPEDMRKDTLLADRPWLRMEAERMAREGAAFY